MSQIRHLLKIAWVSDRRPHKYRKALFLQSEITPFAYRHSTIRKGNAGELKDGAIAHVYDADGNLVEIERYEFTGEFCGAEPLVNTRTETANGQLICRQVAHRVSDTALDLHVIDAEGTLRLIIHHSDIDRGEPCTIREEWIDP